MSRVRIWLAYVAVAACSTSCEKPVSRKRFETAERPAPSQPLDSRTPADESAVGDSSESGEEPFGDPLSPELESLPPPVDAERRRLLGIRRRMTGQFYVNLQVGGYFLKDATIRKINDRGVQIEFENGIVTLAWAELTHSYRRKWGYDPEREIKMPENPIEFEIPENSGDEIGSEVR